MSEIIPVLPLNGKLSTEATIKAVLSPDASISGIMSIAPPPPGSYEGEYEVTPNANEDTTLHTFNKLVNDNIVIHKIPYFETSNESGTTIYIGG